MGLAAFRFLAVIMTGLALIGPAAHLFSLANKIDLAKDQYFIAQQVYNGWWKVGLLLPAAVVCNAVLAILVRNDRPAMTLAAVATALVLLELIIFTIWTQPANAATSNWTTQPDNWAALRTQWEYSHAVNAGIMFVAFCTATMAALRTSGQ
jgi:hypothetical protein